MKPQDFVKEINRMCKSNGKFCARCPMIDSPCSFFMNGIKQEQFAKMYDAVVEWSDSHPIETRQSEFLKMFPRAKVRDGVISLCPQFYCITLLGTDFTGCNPNDCAKCLREYWLAEMTDNE